MYREIESHVTVCKISNEKPSKIDKACAILLAIRFTLYYAA